MRYVVTDVDTIPEWLYPGSWPECPTGPDHEMEADDSLDLSVLWSILTNANEEPSPFSYQSFEHVGIPHDAPDDVNRLNVEFIQAILNIPVHERWKVAKQWAGNPNEESLAIAKKHLNRLCELAELAKQESKFIAILGPAK